MASDFQDLTGRDLADAVHDLLGIQSRVGIGFLDPGRIPELFAEIAARADDGWVDVARDPEGMFEASVSASHWHRKDCSATGSTPNEALARLLLMVARSG